MVDPNVAYTKEYEDYRKRFEPVFAVQYRTGECEESALPDGKHLLNITQFSDESGKINGYRISASLTKILNTHGQMVAEFKSISHIGLYSYIEHTNGRNYLVFSIDLYGYSILDLYDYHYVHYVPESSFNKGKETFIWTKALYCPSNNILAVDGCFWAYPGSTEFYDFIEPMSLPLDRICTSNDMKDQIDTDDDVTPIQWNADGSIKLEIIIDNERIEKDIDVMSYKK